MKKQTKPPRGMAFVAALAAGACLAQLCLPMNSAYAKQPVACNVNLVKQPFLKRSICIYQAILADVDKTYRALDGNIGSIAEITTTTYKVMILLDGRIDYLDYTVRIGAGGKVEIVDKKESTQTMGAQ